VKHCIKNNEDRNNIWRDEIIRMLPTQGKQIFPLNLHWAELQICDFCCDNGSPDERDVQAGLTYRMVSERYDTIYSTKMDTEIPTET
jgi:hypothetical protein